MFDVITIGSSTRDMFVKSSAFKILKSSQFPTGKALAMSLGSKIHVDEITFFVGGGAVNTAVTFANQGLRTAAFTVIGKDPGGEAIQSFLKEKNISQKFVRIDRCAHTSYSVVLTAGRKDRSILRYDGSVWHFQEIPFPERELANTRWFYLNHIGKEGIGILPKIFKLVQRHNIKIAWNPGSTQLTGNSSIRPYAHLVDVCIFNQEEASEFTKVPYQDREKIFDVLDRWIKGIVIMTRGPKGVEVSDGKTRWSAGVLPLKKIVDRTGAGDAFGSGFVAALIKKPGDIEYAIQFASANATGVLTQWGATNGLLKKGDSPYTFGTLKIKKTIL